MVAKTRFWFVTAALALAITAWLSLTIANTSTTPTASACCNYNRSAAASYADRWSTTTSGYGVRNPSYPDYSPNDCANFVSQAMAAGGLPQNQGNHDENDTHLWYFYSDPFFHSSKTWRAVDWMNQYFSNYQGTYFHYTSPSASNLAAGDVLLMALACTTCVPDHARFIVGNGYSEAQYSPATMPAGTYGLLSDSHTNDRHHAIWIDGIPSNTPLWAWNIVY